MPLLLHTVTAGDNNTRGKYRALIVQQPSNPRKRQRTEQHPPPSPPSKWKKHHHSPKPPAFWDSLSKIWLTRGALRELNRRNTTPHQSDRSARRPITRAFKAERKTVHQRLSTADILRRCAPRRLKDLKKFARRGGPDLSHLNILLSACQ